MKVITRYDIEEKRDSRYNNFEVYEFDVLDIESLVLSRLRIDTRFQDITPYLEIPTVEDAIQSGKVTQEQIDAANLQVWKNDRLSHENEFADDIRYCILNNMIEQNILIPCAVDGRGYSYDGILVRYTIGFSNSATRGNRIYSEAHSSRKFGTYAEVLTAEGKIKKEPKSYIRILDSVISKIANKYKQLIIDATDTNVMIQELFPFNIDEQQ